jgi:hypothetical protein
MKATKKSVNAVRGAVWLIHPVNSKITVQRGYNDIGLSDTSPIASDSLWNQLFVTVDRNTTLVGYNNTRL